MRFRRDDQTESATAKGVLLVIIAIFVASAAFAIIHFYRQEKQVGAEELPIVFVLSPDHGRNLSPDDRAELADFLKRESGLHIEIRIAGTSLDAIEAFGGGSRGGEHGSADVGLLNLFEYVLARKEYGVEAALQVLRAGNATGYHGVIAVRGDDPIQSIGDLSGKRIAFVDPYSTSGFVFTARILRDAGIEAVTDFAGDHAEALRRLKAGEADAAATYASAVDADPTLRVIVRTDTIPNEPIFFRREVRAEKRVALVNAFAKLATTPEGVRLLGRIADITDLQPITDEGYSEVTDAIRAAGKSVYEVVPEGLQVESRRRGINYIP